MGDLEMMEFLVNNGANINGEAENKMTVLISSK